ncbi:hypothetical protein ISCGN_031050 [Ixodes scapularis]
MLLCIKHAQHRCLRYRQLKLENSTSKRNEVRLKHLKTPKERSVGTIRVPFLHFSRETFARLRRRQPITSTFTNMYLNARLVQIPTLLPEGYAAVRWHRGQELTSVYGQRSVCSGAHYPAAWRLPLVAVAYDRWRFFL